MRFSWLVAGLLVLAPASAPWAGAAKVLGQERPVSGPVTGIDLDDGYIWLGPMRILVPADVFDLEELDEGVKAIVDYVQSDEGPLATKLRVDALPR